MITISHLSKTYHNPDGSVITVRAKGVKLNELAEITTRFGKSLAEVNKIDGDMVSLQVFAGGRGVSTNDQISFIFMAD